jgi:hypothetical protein
VTEQRIKPRHARATTTTEPGSISYHASINSDPRRPPRASRPAVAHGFWSPSFPGDVAPTHRRGAARAPPHNPNGRAQSSRAPFLPGAWPRPSLHLLLLPAVPVSHAHTASRGIGRDRERHSSTGRIRTPLCSHLCRTHQRAVCRPGQAPRQSHG